MREMGAEGQLRARAAAAPAPSASPSPPPRVYYPKAPARDPGAGYWNYVAGAVIILFVLYIIKKGELQTWINLLFFNPAAAPTVNPTQAGQTGAPVAGQNAQGQPTLYPSNPPNASLSSIGSTAGTHTAKVGAVIGGLAGLPLYRSRSQLSRRRCPR